jgi:hypothetical protein
MEIVAILKCSVPVALLFQSFRPDRSTGGQLEPPPLRQLRRDSYAGIATKAKQTCLSNEDAAASAYAPCFGFSTAAIGGLI